MTISHALAGTATILAIPAVIGWIVAGWIYGGLSVSRREEQPRGLWPSIFGALSLLSLAIVVLLLASIWTQVP